jgi:wyosine [tRNA(Phe)-imidazoG37] synthetase (radical SAM superfamily)
MLVDRMDYGNEFGKIADFLGHLKGLDKAYIAIPTRPPTEKWVRPAKEDMLNAAFQAFANKLGQSRVEYLTGYEGNAFAFTGEAEEDLLSITAVHPMRREAVEEFLKKSGVEWDLMKRLLNERKLVELDYEGKTFYMRRLHNR